MPGSRSPELRTAQWPSGSSRACLVLWALACLAVLLQVRTSVPDSRLALHIDPAGFLHDLFQQWDPSEDLGHRTGSLLAYLPIAGLFTLMRAAGISVLGAQQVFFVGVLFFSAFGMWLFYELFWESSVEVGRWAAALLYAFNPYVLLNIGGSPAGTTVLLLPYMAAPWIASQLVRCVRLRRFRHGLVAAAMLGLVAPGVNATVNLITFVGCGTILVVEVWRARFLRRVVTLAFWSMVVCALASLWWLGPFLSSLRHGGANFYLQTDPLTIGASASSFREVLRLLGLWALYQGYNGVPYYPTQGYFASIPVVMATMIGSVSLFGAMARYWDDVRTRSMAAILVIAIPMAVSIHPVGSPALSGLVYQWLFDSFVPFRSFRSNYKWVALIVLVYAIVIPRCLLTGTKAVEVISSIAIGVFLLANIIPFFVPGLLFPPGYRLGTVPVYWRDAGRWLDAQPGPGRVLFTPDQGFSVYAWGRPQGDIAPLVTERPVVTSHIALATTSGGQELVKLAGEAVVNPDVPYEKVLDLLGVGFVVQRNDVDWRYYRSASPAEMRAFLEAQPHLRFARSFGMLDIYRVVGPTPIPVGVARRLAQITADGGLRGGLHLYQRGALAVFEQPHFSNPAIEYVRASSGSENGPIDAMPFRAFDGDKGTSWVPGKDGGARPWLELRFVRPEILRDVEVVTRPDDVGLFPPELTVSTDSVRKQVVVAPDGVSRFSLTGPGSRSLRVQVARGSGYGGSGISEVIIPGLPGTALEYRARPNRLASFRVDLDSAFGETVTRRLIVPERARYRIQAELWVDGQLVGSGAASRAETSGDLVVLEGPSQVRVPVRAEGRPGVRRFDTEVELGPGTFVVRLPPPSRLRLRSLYVVPVDQASAQLRSVPVSRRSPTSLTVDVPRDAHYLYFGETTDPLWGARRGLSALPRAGVGNGYGNLWSAGMGTPQADIEFDGGGSPGSWLTFSLGGLLAVTAAHLAFERRRRLQ